MSSGPGPNTPFDPAAVAVVMLTTRLDDLTAAARRLLAALDACESNRGRFSCTEAHDGRCPKSRADNPADWRGEWRCECGAEELWAAIRAAEAALGGGR